MQIKFEIEIDFRVLKPLPKQGRILFSSRQIQSRVKQLASEIDDHYQNRELVVIGVLNGSVIFLADLIRRLKSPLNLDCVAASSYGKSVAVSNKVLFRPDLKLTVKGAHILLVDDILDTGKTAAALFKFLKSLQPASIELCVLLRKRVRRIIPVRARFVGFNIPNCFVYGYGLDIAEKFRNLPYIAAQNFPKASC